MADSGLKMLLEQYLAVREEPCPLCGYNLHKLCGRACPECGHELTLQIRAVNPRLAAFYTGLVGLAAGVGFVIMLFLYVAIFSLFLGWGLPPMRDLLVLFVEGILLTAFLMVWIRRSGSIRRLSCNRRWGLALASWGLSIGAMIVFFVIADM